MRRWQSLALIGGAGLALAFLGDFASQRLGESWQIPANVAAMLAALLALPAWWLTSQPRSKWTRFGLWTLPISGPALFLVSTTWAVLVLCGLAIVFVFHIFTE